MILCEATQIWIYGYGGRGRTIKRRLEKEGMEVYGYIDQKPEQYEEDRKSIRILKPQEVHPVPNAVVICSVTNVFSHETIAELLAKQGFSYIIYKSFRKTMGARRLGILYDDLTSIFEGIAVGQQVIPQYSFESESKIKLSNNEENTICVNIPVELLFGSTRELLDQSLLDKNEYILRMIPEQSILYYTSPQKMMQYFMWETDENVWNRCKELWYACRNAQSFSSSSAGSYDIDSQEKNLEDRYSIFQKMEQLFCENPAFFCENPISVIWNRKGGFNIQDGNNRAAFLLAKGFYYIPSRMSLDDYKAWMDVEEIKQQLKSALNNIKIELRSPVLHPLFMDISCQLKFYSHRKAAVLSDWLWRMQLNPKDMEICEYYCSNDLCGSHLSRMGGKLTICDVEEQMNLHKILDHLYYLDSVYYCKRVKNSSFTMLISNQEDALKRLVENRILAEWYILEYVGKSDTEIEEKISRYLSEKPVYLMRQLVGSKIYKVVVVKGEK